MLFAKIDHEAMAKTLRVSVATVRQARLKDGAAARRSPPEGWQRAAAQLAKQRVGELEALMRSLDTVGTTRADLAKKFGVEA